jgi:hypothetical protein
MLIPSGAQATYLPAYARRITSGDETDFRAACPGWTAFAGPLIFDLTLGMAIPPSIADRIRRITDYRPVYAVTHKLQSHRPIESPTHVYRRSIQTAQHSIVRSEYAIAGQSPIMEIMFV